MTICIAAISENDKIVAVTDRMFTLQQPVATTYEITENNKAIELTDSVIALFAGDVIHANAILQRARNNLNNANPAPTTTKEIAEIVNKSYSEYWESVVTNVLMRQYQITFQQFMHNQGSFDVDLVKKLNDFIGKIVFNIEIIVAGKHSDETESHVYSMDSAGTVTSNSSTGYACIGSGSKHATFSLIESEINKTMSITETLHNLLKAKTRAEYDPGVGKLCDIVVIDGNIKRYNQIGRDKILKIFEECRTQHKALDKKTLKELEKVI